MISPKVASVEEGIIEEMGGGAIDNRDCWGLMGSKNKTYMGSEALG